MKTKNIILSAVLLFIPLSYGGVYAYNSNATVKDVEISGKYIGFDSLQQLEEAADLIVVGKKKGTKETIVELDETNAYTDAYSLADIEIKKVIKNNTNKDFTKKDNIIVMEYAAYDTDNLGKKRFFHLEDYEMMEDNKHYALFLRESTTDPGVYLIRGVVYGKVSLDSAEEVENKKANRIIKQAKDKYKDELTVE